MVLNRYYSIPMTGRDELWTTKYHFFGHSLLHVYVHVHVAIVQKLLHHQHGGQDRDKWKFTLLDGYALLVCVC